MHEWLASSFVDDQQLDYMEDLCGQLVPKEARSARKVTRPGATGAAASRSTAGGGGSGSTFVPDHASIRGVREVLGHDYGDGFIMQCLLHYGSVATVVGAVLDGNLPPQLANLPQDMSMGDFTQAQNKGLELMAPSREPEMSREDKLRTLQSVERQTREEAAAAAAAAEQREYDDDYDDAAEAFGRTRMRVGDTKASDSGEEDGGSGTDSSDEGDPRWRDGGGKGKGKAGKERGPTQGQTVQARRKEENKARVANHNRRDQARRKMAKGMF